MISDGATFFDLEVLSGKLSYGEELVFYTTRTPEGSSKASMSCEDGQGHSYNVSNKAQLERGVGFSLAPRVSVSRALGDEILIHTENTCQSSSLVGRSSVNGVDRSIDLSFQNNQRGQSYDLYLGETSGGETFCSSNSFASYELRSLPAVVNSFPNPGIEARPEFEVSNLLPGDSAPSLFTTQDCSGGAQDASFSNGSFTFNSNLSIGEHAFFIQMSVQGEAPVCGPFFTYELLDGTTTNIATLHEGEVGFNHEFQVEVRNLLDGINEIKIYTDACLSNPVGTASTTEVSGTGEDQFLSINITLPTPSSSQDTLYDLFLEADSTCSTNKFASYTLRQIPSVTNLSPTSPGLDSTPRVDVSGLKSGDVVLFFQGPNCTDPKEAQPKTFAGGITPFSISPSPLEQGVHTDLSVQITGVNSEITCLDAPSYELRASPSLAFGSGFSSLGFSKRPVLDVLSLLETDVVSLYSDSSCSSSISSTVEDFSSSQKKRPITIDDDLDPASSPYSFFIKVETSDEALCMTQSLNYDLHISPSSKTAKVSLPDHLPPFHDEEKSPTITIGELSDGDMVELYVNDSTCNNAPVISGGEGPFVVNQELSFGMNNFYAKISTSTPPTQESSCLDIALSYELIEIPTPPTFSRQNPTEGGVTPGITLNDVRVGDQVSLYKESCSEDNKLGEGTVSLETSILIEVQENKLSFNEEVTFFSERKPEGSSVASPCVQGGNYRASNGASLSSISGLGLSTSVSVSRVEGEEIRVYKNSCAPENIVGQRDVSEAEGGILTVPITFTPEDRGSTLDLHLGSRGQGKETCDPQKFSSYTIRETPEIAYGSPSVGVAFNPSPTFSVTGLEEGDTLFLYKAMEGFTGNICDVEKKQRESETQVGPLPAGAGGNTPQDLTPSTPFSVGLQDRFRVEVTDSSGGKVCFSLPSYRVRSPPYSKLCF